jgi:thioredoxin reductase (NADPH)
MTHGLKDITIIGAGPTGLYALFYAGMRGVSAQVIDALPQVGGQLAALYPEKLIFDVAGFPRVLAKDLVTGLYDQAAQFASPLHLNRTVTGLDEVDGHFVVRTSDGDFPTKSVVVAGGIGAFSPRKLPQVATHPWYGKGIDDVVLDPARFTNKHVLIVRGRQRLRLGAAAASSRAVDHADPSQRPLPRPPGDGGRRDRCGRQRRQDGGAHLP